MDWQAVAFDWNRARAFLVTAEEGSFSAAARALGMSQPTVGRQVAALEQELEVTLFERVGAGLELTAAGLDLLEHVRVMGKAASLMALAATGRAETIEGTVCISASEINAVYILPPIIERIRRTHPAVEIEIVASNNASDLRRREERIEVLGIDLDRRLVPAQALLGIPLGEGDGAEENGGLRGLRADLLGVAGRLAGGRVLGPIEEGPAAIEVRRVAAGLAVARVVSLSCLARHGDLV